MKPFNLEAAMRGDPVITRDGRPYKFGAYNPDAYDQNKIIGWVDGGIKTHTVDGKRGPYSNKFDLFMAPKKAAGWINIYPKNTSSMLYEDKEYADAKDDGWEEATIAWEVCAFIHAKYAKGKDAFFTTRHADFVNHAASARVKAMEVQEEIAKRDQIILEQQARINEVRGCFDAAFAEGLWDRLAEGLWDRLNENGDGSASSWYGLYVRRLAYAYRAVENAGIAALQAHDKEIRANACEDYARYQELIYAVASKFPGETRHETALRYIRNAEKGGNACTPGTTRKE